jgi:DNA adenine methylase
MYRAIQRDYAEVMCHVLRLNDAYMPLDREGRKTFYYEIMDRHAHDHREVSRPELAALHLFLRATSFKGFAQNGRQRLGRFSTGAGLLDHTASFVDLAALDYWHEALQGVQINHGDWADNIPDLGRHDLAFLDPPYRGSYTNYAVPQFNDAQLGKLVAWAAGAAANVMLSNCDVGDGFFERMIEGSDLELVRFAGRKHTGGRVNRETGKKQPVVELLIYRKDAPR